MTSDIHCRLARVLIAERIQQAGVHPRFDGTAKSPRIDRSQRSS
jgi:hypothetical protein